MEDEILEALRKLERVTGLKLELAARTEEEMTAAKEKLSMLTLAYQERYDKSSFIRSMLRGELTRQELQSRASHFHLQKEMRYFLLVIETKPKHQKMAVNILKEMFISRAGDAVVSMDDRKIILMKPVARIFADQIAEEIESLARTSVETLNAEAMIRARVGYSEVAEPLEKLSDSYRETCMALTIGRTFYNGKTVMSYQKLGIGRLIYRLPKDVCRQFLDEVFRGQNPEIDDETYNLINAFFKNNLNLSETARQMFVHRNTLVYRIEKLHQMTGLDLRNFDEAVELKIALMVASCLKAKEKEDDA